LLKIARICISVLAHTGLTLQSYAQSVAGGVGEVELVRSGDLLAVGGADGDNQSSLRIDRSSLERWLVTGSRPGVPLTPRNAWAIVGLASGDDVLSLTMLT